MTVNIWHDWAFIYRIGQLNWHDFTFIHLSVEYDNRFGDAEIHAAILGLHLRVVVKVSSGDVEFQEALQKSVDEWKDKLK